MSTPSSCAQEEGETVQERELGTELGEYKYTLTQTALSSMTDEFSYLSTRELLDNARVIATISTRVKPLLRVACGGTNEAWISGREKIIRRVDLNGCELDSVATTCTDGPCLACPGNISVTRQGELIYSDSNNETVNIVRNGRTEVLITTPQGWRPHELCYTRSRDILVCVCREKQNKILRYEGNIMKQEIDKDDNGILISRAGNRLNFVSENNNGDICVSDCNVDILIVVDKSGRVRFRYDGTAARREKSFSPRYVVTDSLSQIIVTDYNNGCLHILDMDGQLLKCVDNCGLDSPGGLSVDSEGRLWVGVATSGDVKVIQYVK